MLGIKLRCALIVLVAGMAYPGRQLGAQMIGNSFGFGSRRSVEGKPLDNAWLSLTPSDPENRLFALRDYQADLEYTMSTDHTAAAFAGRHFGRDEAQAVVSAGYAVGKYHGPAVRLCALETDRGIFLGEYIASNRGGLWYQRASFIPWGWEIAKFGFAESAESQGDSGKQSLDLGPTLRIGAPVGNDEVIWSEISYAVSVKAYRGPGLLLFGMGISF